jgi:hypothetical protein
MRRDPGRQAALATPRRFRLYSRFPLLGMPGAADWNPIVVWMQKMIPSRDAISNPRWKVSHTVLTGRTNLSPAGSVSMGPKGNGGWSEPFRNLSVGDGSVAVLRKILRQFAIDGKSTRLLDVSSRRTSRSLSPCRSPARREFVERIVAGDTAPLRRKQTSSPAARCLESGKSLNRANLWIR